MLHKNDRGFSSENLIVHKVQEGLPWWLSGTESACSVGDRFDPWIGKIPRRREKQPTPVLLPGEFHEQRSLAGYSPWGSQRVQHNLATKQQQQQGSRGKMSRNETRKLRAGEIIKFLPNLHSLRKPSNGFRVYSIDNDEPVRL